MFKPYAITNICVKKKVNTFKIWLQDAFSQYVTLHKCAFWWIEGPAFAHIAGHDALLTVGLERVRIRISAHHRRYLIDFLVS